MSISFSILHHFYLLLPICLLSNIEWIVYIKYFDTYTVSYMLNPIWFTFIKIHPRENSKLISDLYICFHSCPFFILLIPFVYILSLSLSLFFPVDLISCWRWWKWMGLVLLFWPLDSLDRCIHSVYYVWFYVQTFTEPSHTMQFRRWSYIRWINFTWPTTW